MIRDAELGLVVQGETRAATIPALTALRALYSSSPLVFSTYTSARFERDRAELAMLADTILVSDDPGSLPPTVISPTAPPNNVNRQIVSTAAGLRAIDTPYALKLRSDLILGARGIEADWQRVFDETGVARRLAAFSIYTRHPRGINGYLFHLSDWMQFGRSDELRRYWAAECMPLDQATFYERHRHGWSETPTARRFRARFTPEQWLCRQYAAPLGYAVPDWLVDRSPGLVRDYERFLAERCLIIDPIGVGAHLHEHRGALRSRFQRIDCVSHKDWRAMLEAERGGGSARVDIVRRVARRSRWLVGAEIVVEKSLKMRLAGRSRPRPA